MATRYDVGLLDLDGVLYLGDEAVEGAPGAVVSASELGMRMAYVTNNAARTPQAVAEHLRALGVPAEPSDVVTSAQAAARLVAERVAPQAQVLVIGGPGLVEALIARGLTPVSTLTDGVAAVVQGFSPDLDWSLLSEGAYAVAAGLPWIASNLDPTVPTPRGRAPGNGSLVDVVATAGGRRPDAVAGKPETPLLRESIDRTQALRPLVVGDRLDTDIEGGHRGGVPTLLVLTGVTGPAEVALAGPAQRPTYLAEELWSGLLAPHPAVKVRGDGGTCGGWTVTVSESGPAIEGAGSRVDGLRALCVAVWAAADHGAHAGMTARRVNRTLGELGW